MQLIRIVIADQTNATLAGAATLIACAFALATFDRWHQRGQRHDLAWTIAMSLFAGGSAMLWIAETTGWTTSVFRVFFLFGAVLNVAWLGLGTIYLLIDKKIGDRIALWLIAYSAFSAGVIFSTPTSGTIRGNEFPAGRDLFGPVPRLLAAFGSGVPAIVIIGGAIWSMIQVFRRRSQQDKAFSTRTVISSRRLAVANILIAIGTLVLSASGMFAARLGKDRAFAVSLLLGLCLLFCGFLVASNSTRRKLG